ncbi:unnamed protein product [Tenebrio molitor]|jgi:hypothetical protein|nr:unnamed protein product [Tenebrio molitor]
MVGQRTMLKKILLMKRNWENTRRIQKLTGVLFVEMSSKVVEIDESKFFHRKYHRRRWRAGHWVFGGIERNTKKCFLVEVPDRTVETLSNLIQRYVYQKN